MNLKFKHYTFLLLRFYNTSIVKGYRGSLILPFFDNFSKIPSLLFLCKPDKRRPRSSSIFDFTHTNEKKDLSQYNLGIQFFPSSLMRGVLIENMKDYSLAPFSSEVLHIVNPPWERLDWIMSSEYCQIDLLYISTQYNAMKLHTTQVLQHQHFRHKLFMSK